MLKPSALGPLLLPLSLLACGPDDVVLLEDTDDPLCAVLPFDQCIEADKFEPEFAVVSQIKPFTVTPQMIADLCARSTLAPCDVNDHTRVALGLEELARSSNNILPFLDANKSFNEFKRTKEYRGILEVDASGVSCTKINGQIRTAGEAYVFPTMGYTPIRTPLGTYYSPGQSGGSSVQKTVNGASTTWVARMNMRIDPGMGEIGQILIPGTIIPWVWSELSVTITCFEKQLTPPPCPIRVFEKSVDVTAKGSNFPTHYFYGGVDGMAYRSQRGQGSVSDFVFGPAIAAGGTIGSFSKRQRVSLVSCEGPLL